MSGNQTIHWPKQQTSILAGVALAHALFLFLLMVNMSPASRLFQSHKPPIQLPVPLPMAMVDIIETPGATGNPTASLSQHYQPNPSVETTPKPDSAAKSITKPIPKPIAQAASKTIKKEDRQQNTKAAPVLTNSKTAITANEKESNAGNGTGNQVAASSGSGVGDDSGNKSHSGSGSGNGRASSPGAQSAGSVGPSTSPSFGAAYLNNPAPKYPPMARRNGEQGKVLLRVLVTSDGLAKQVNLHSSSGSSSLDDAAITAVKKWRFVPAKQAGEPVEAWVQVPIVFKLDS